LFQIIAVRIEIGQCDVAGVIARVDAIGRTGATRGAGSVLADSHRDRNHLTRLYVAQFWPGPPVGRARRQVKQQVDNAWRFAIEQPRIKLLELRSNAGKAGERGKQGIENERSHSIIIAKISASCPAMTNERTPSI